MRRFWAPTISVFILLTAFVSVEVFPVVQAQETTHAAKFCKRKSHKAKSPLPCTCSGVMIASCTDCGSENKKPETYPALQSDADSQSCEGATVQGEKSRTYSVSSTG